MRKTILFDMDGTVLDTLDDLTDAVNYALSKNGLPVRSREEVRSFLGNGERILILRAVPDETPEEVSKTVQTAFHVYYEANSSRKTRAYPGIPEALRKLRRAGCSLGVISNKTDEAVRDLCFRYFPGLFDVSIGDNEALRRKKPFPDGVFDAMRFLGSAPEDCLFVGDSDVDLNTARNAGLPFIGCAWGFRGRAFLEASGAEAIADEPEDLPDRILRFE
ncbi:MAG: HAD-IA family hydrolase [Clostridia bacterium]|nr:HAD-IA family hydrolase [Clostridia bacterium]